VHAGALRSSPLLFVLQPLVGDTSLGVGERRRVGRHVQQSGVRIEQHRLALGYRFQRRTRGDQHRQAHRAREDRDVRRRSAAHGAQSDDACKIEPGELGRKQVVRQHDRALWPGCGRLPLRGQAERREYLAFEILKVGNPFAKVAVIELQELHRLLAGGIAPGLPGTAPVADRALRNVVQHGIVEQ
jgi:hypothetical protein